MSKALRRTTAVAMAAALGAAGAPASAGQTTGTLPVSVTVFTGCSLQTRPLTFDATTVSGNNPLDATTTITVKCTPNTNFTVDIDNGLNANGKSSNRQMKSQTGGLLAYDVYRDSPRTNVWGTGQLKNVTGNSGTGAPLDLLIYGRVPNASKVVAGDYKDTLVVTLTF